MKQLAVRLVQLRAEKAAIDQNLRGIEQHVAEADRAGIDLILFPETSVTGYADPTCHPEACLDVEGPEVQRLAALSRSSKMTVVAGVIEANPGSKPYITQVVLQGGRIAGVYRKVTIKDDEERWFTPGSDLPTFWLEGHCFALAVCADIDNEDIFAAAARQGARLVLHAAAPGLYGEQATRDWKAGFTWWENACRDRLGRYARSHGLWIAVATQAGRTIDEDFPGGGYLFAPDGSRHAASLDWSEGYLDVVIPPNVPG